VTQDDPEEDENENGAEAAAAEFLGTPSGSETPKNFAHGSSP
jgi:hypothetical protein